MNIQEQMQWLELQANTPEYRPAAEREIYNGIKDTMEVMLKRQELLEKVVEAVSDIKWHSIEKDNMEFSTTCFVKERIEKALAALKEQNESHQ